MTILKTINKEREENKIMVNWYWEENFGYGESIPSEKGYFKTKERYDLFSGQNCLGVLLRLYVNNEFAFVAWFEDNRSMKKQLDIIRQFDWHLNMFYDRAKEMAKFLLKNNVPFTTFYKEPAIEKGDDNIYITNVGIDGDHLKYSDDSNIMSGICTIYETEDKEDYETDVEFKFDKKEGKLISLSSPNRDFTKIELAVIEEILRDNIKVNF